MSRSRLNVAVLLCGLLAAVSTEAEIPDRLESVGTNRPHQPLETCHHGTGRRPLALHP